ncbi:MAG TPA: TrmB family transcriptional regulator [Patescibacteria group bacterium]|nr:TrmB family transcriptional regulator [Patescibacteria group bacterium]
MHIHIVETLKDLGFSEYEAKAYLALLAESPLSGYGVAKKSGVPRSKIYEVLNSLVARGDIMMSPGSTSQYIPLSATKLIAHKRAKTEQALNLAERHLEKYAKSPDDRSNIWNITGDTAIINKVKDCIATAQHRILIEIWEQDFFHLKEDLLAASQRDVSVTIISYGHLTADFATVYYHDMSQEITDEYGGRWLVFSADDQEVVAGVLSLKQDSRAAWTMHPGLVMPITEVMIHDLYILEIMNEFRATLEAKFGKNLIDLRHKFSFNEDLKKHYI